MSYCILGLYSTSRNILRNCHSISNNISRTLSTSSFKHGIEEFFSPGVYEGEKYVEEEPVVGRRWKASELRIRSNSDLHKFWYVLLKERNMLLTLEQECKRLGRPMPGPTRLHKVAQTMSAVKTVIQERNNAVLELEKERRYKFDEYLEREKEEIALAAEKENTDSDFNVKDKAKF